MPFNIIKYKYCLMLLMVENSTHYTKITYVKAHIYHDPTQLSVVIPASVLPHFYKETRKRGQRYMPVLNVSMTSHICPQHCQAGACRHAVCGNTCMLGHLIWLSRKYAVLIFTRKPFNLFLGEDELQAAVERESGCFALHSKSAASMTK